MAENVLHEVDCEQVKKAIKALLAHHKSKNTANSLLLNEHDRISLMLTVWKIPSQTKTIKIPLPHGIRPDTCDVCLFTRDEPNMSAEQTEKFYRKLLSKHGLKQITEVIPLKKMKKEYKPFEAKRRLLSSFDLFLADERIRRLLPSLIGKHFYKAKREPLSVKLKGKNLAAVLKRNIQGTLLHITNKGCCYDIRVGHTGMEVGDTAENVLAVAQNIAEKLPQKWKNVKVLHLKTQSSVALPIYTSSFNNLKELILNVTTKKTKSAKEGKPVTPASDGAENQLADTKDSATSPKKKLLKEPVTSPKKKLLKESVTSPKKKLLKKKLLKESVTSPKKKLLKESVTSPKKKLLKESVTSPKKKLLKESVTSPKKLLKESVTSPKKKLHNESVTPPKKKKLHKESVTPPKKQKLDKAEEEEEIPQLVPIQEPSTAKKSKKKKKDVQEETKVEGKSKSSEEDVQVSPTEKRTLLKRKMNKSENAVKTPVKLKKELPSEGETKEPEKLETPPRRSILKKTPKKKDVQEEPNVEGKSKSSEEDVHVSPTEKRTLRKRKVNESENAVKTPVKNQKDLLSEGKTKEPEKLETPPRPSILKKTPKKTPSTAAVKLTRSAKKAPQTPKLKQKKKMSAPPTA
ncbi:ribosomal L1 domain-containing protein 1 isoform X2 [Eleutherodactylus coqui]|uniref:ribosomal L1 domain-containing protein 1 isoform X2 n=1 Tax=Eleutherodactylus coqui TaxID=57060 RepID=UPI0034628D2B